MSADRLSQDTTSSAVTLDYDQDEQEQHPTDFKVLDQRSPSNSVQGPTLTANEQTDIGPDTSVCDSSVFDDRNGDQREIEDDEDRRNSTSGITDGRSKTTMVGGKLLPVIGERSKTTMEFYFR